MNNRILLTNSKLITVKLLHFFIPFFFFCYVSVLCNYCEEEIPPSFLRGLQNETILNVASLDRLYVQDVQHHTYGISISSEAGAFATISKNGIQLWDLEKGSFLGTLMSRSEMDAELGKPLAVLFSFDGNWFAAGGEKCAVLWDARTLEEVWRRSDLQNRATLSFSPDCSTLFLGQPPDDAEMDVYQREKYLVFHERGDLANVRSGETLTSFSNSYVPWFPYASNSQHFCIADANKNTVRIFHRDTQSWTTISVNQGDSEYTQFNYMAFLPQTEQLITRTAGTVKSPDDQPRNLDFWDARSGERVKSILLYWSPEIGYFGTTVKGMQPMFISPDGKTLLGGCPRWDTWQNMTFYSRQNWDLSNGDLISAGQYGPGSWYVLSPFKLSPDGNLLIYDGAGTKKVCSLSGSNAHCVDVISRALDFSKDYLKAYYSRPYQLSSQELFEIDKMDISNLENDNTFLEKRFLLFNEDKPNSSVFTHSDDYLLWNSRFINAKKWSYETHLIPVIVGCGGYPTSSVFSPDDRYFVMNHGKGVYIWDFPSKAQVAYTTGTVEDDRLSFAFSHSGNILLAGTGKQQGNGVENLVQLWSVPEFQVIKSIEGHSDSVWYAEFSPDDRRIVSASLDGTAKVWDAESGALIASFVGHASGVEYAAFFPDGDRILSTGRDRKAYVWNAEAAEIERTFDGIHLPAQLSPDGKHLFAGSEVWNVETGERIKTLDGVAQDYSCLTLSPDGTMLLTSEYEGFTKVWNVQEHILKPVGVWDYEVYK